MFEFLFKRPGDKPAETATVQGAASAGNAPSGLASAARAEQAEKLASLGGDELAATEFILQCEFSELRLAAAELVHQRAHLERLHGAMRNTDRRVAKLMQGRLDAIRHRESELARGQDCIDQAQGMLGLPMLTPNHVADLDRKWAVVSAPELGARFETLRAQLHLRLQAQMQLQRAMIDQLAEMRRLGASDMPTEALAERLEQMARAQEQALAAPEHASLPRSLTNEFAREHARLSATLAPRARDQAALAARQAALADWQNAEPAALDAEQLTKTWQQLARAAPEQQAALDQRFAQLLASLPATARPTPMQERRRAGQQPDQHYIDTLEAMEVALQHGSLGAAAELDKILKETKGVRLPPALAERLAHVRAELKHLSDWARWGGNVSREELIKAVEALSLTKLSMSELAKKVGSMRERWKALDTLSGAAPKSLWERFDAACSAAYAPAAAHFKHLADERNANAARAHALIDEALSQTARLGANESVDWKQMALTVQRMRLAWSHLGALERKEKKRLDQQFTDALNVLQGPLEVQRKTEMDVREELIAQAGAIDALDRHAPEALRALQERWQEHARALPLERKSEQALWQRFRSACDAVFARRKQGAHAADAERRAHLLVKEALCARLEAAGSELGALGKLMHDVGAEWQATGAVPRAAEAALEKRYQGALAALGRQQEAARRNAGVAQTGALRDKLRLCQQLEAQLAEPDGAVDPAADWQARWSAQGDPGAQYSVVLQARFDAALAVLAGDRKAYAELLESNRGALQHALLRLEIGAGIDCGSEFARERLALQVEALQGSLKSGHKPLSQAAQFLQVCALPALADARTASRMMHLSTRIAREGK